MILRGLLITNRVNSLLASGNLSLITSSKLVLSLISQAKIWINITAQRGLNLLRRNLSSVTINLLILLVTPFLFTTHQILLKLNFSSRNRTVIINQLWLLVTSLLFITDQILLKMNLPSRNRTNIPATIILTDSDILL